MTTYPDPLTEHRSRQWHQAASGSTADADSIRAPREIECAQTEFPILPLSRVGGGTAADWFWEGYLAARHITLLSAYAKSGKTTLLGYALKYMLTGGGFVGAARALRVLVVAEESGLIWARRRDELGLDDRVHLCQRPFKGKPSHADWERLITHLADAIREQQYGLVVIDTLANHWPVVNENDASEVTAALIPVRALTEAGAAVLLVHHSRKSDAGEGQAGRGSGALIGFVDIVLELRRFQPQDLSDRRRVLTGYSRFDETPAEAVLELADGEYALLGDRGAAGRAARLGVITKVLSEAGGSLRPEEVRERWPGGAKPGKRAVEEDMAEAAGSGRLIRTGGGTKSSPYRYSNAPGIDSRTTTPSGAGIESGHPQKAPEHDLNHRDVAAPVSPGASGRLPGGGR